MLSEHSRPQPINVLKRTRHTVALAAGDGIGPEITEAVLEILRTAEAPVGFVPIQLGLKAYEAGHMNGVDPEAWGVIREHQVILKGPLTTPQGGGFKSVNVTLRKALGLYANVRPVRALAPYIPTHHPELDVVVIRENEEDVYAGIEHRQSQDVYQCLKLITRPGCERIARYAFEYARTHGRKKVTCMTKDNIMKMTDGLFRKVFEEVGQEYPEIEQQHMIIDIGMAKVAKSPEKFDVVLLPNLYGDILSDVVAEISGSVGIAPSANVGASGVMFEAVHGSAPDIACQGIANPSGMLLASVLMLAHLGEGTAAAQIHNAWLRTIEDGYGTRDLNVPYHKSTSEFAKCVIERLGDVPRRLPVVSYADRAIPEITVSEPVSDIVDAHKTMVGVDIFISSRQTPEQLASTMTAVFGDRAKLEMISNRGVAVWPNRMPETNLVDHYRCRITAAKPTPLWVVNLLIGLHSVGLDVIKTENLYKFNGEKGFSAAQGN